MNFYYALKDLENGGYIIDLALNCNEQEDVKQEILTMFHYDMEIDERKEAESLSLQELCQKVHFELISQEEPFEVTA